MHTPEYCAGVLSEYMNKINSKEQLSIVLPLLTTVLNMIIDENDFTEDVSLIEQVVLNHKYRKDIIDSRKNKQIISTRYNNYKGGIK